MKICAAARPNCIAVSLVIGSRFAVPLTPSVPKSLRMLFSHSSGYSPRDRDGDLGDVFHRPDIVHTKNVRAMLGREGNSPCGPPPPRLYRLIRQLSDESFSRWTNQQGVPQLREDTEIREEIQIMVERFAESDARIHHEPVFRHPVFDCEACPFGQKLG